MSFSVLDRRMMVEKETPMCISEQCSLLGIHRSGFYYVSQGESALNLELMGTIDRFFLEHPHTGVVSMCAYLCMTEGYVVNVKRIRRLMRLMGLMAVYPIKRLSIPDKGHRKYPYLLKDMVINRNNQVWETDIT
ncbi:putative transposase [bacterium A37T11]|nr:putative transposase [bacterium A37T11]